MNNALQYEVIEYHVWIRDDGARASIQGACPWQGPIEKARWKVVQEGYTVRNPFTGETGMGHHPRATREGAEALAVQLGRPSRIGIGD